MTNEERLWHLHVIQRCEESCKHCAAIDFVSQHEALDKRNAANGWDVLRPLEWIAFIGSIIIAMWLAGYPPWYFIMKIVKEVFP